MDLHLLSLVLLLGGGSILGLVGLLFVLVHRVEMQLAARATELLGQGTAPEQIEQQFVAEGFDGETAAKVVHRAEKQAIAASAPELLSRGASEEQVREQLTARGLDRETAADVAAAAAHPSWVRSQRLAGVVLGLPLLLIGVATFVGAIILVFAVKAGQVVSLPVGPQDFRDVADNDFDKTIYVVQATIRDELGKGAMILVVVVGLAFVAGAIAVGGWRVAVRFGLVTVVAGIGMLAFGFMNLAEPSLRFYAPLGFFVSLAGAMVVWCGIEHTRQVDSRVPGKPKRR